MTPAGIKTRLTGLLGIRYPILLGGMAWIGDPDLAADSGSWARRP